jgi:histidine triad (HIT) family protein
MADSIFTRIIRGEIPCAKLHDGPTVIAFLDINPLAAGHALVVPKRPVERLEDLPPEEAADCARVLGGLARRICRATGATGYNILQNNGRDAGQEVPHVHFHIIPRKPGDGLGYRWNARPAKAEDLRALAARLADPATSD